MEKEFEEESKRLRTQILSDVEIYLVKYRDLAKLATEEAKRQKKKAELIKLKTKELTEMTCKSFEEKLRKKMQDDLKKHEEATQSAYSKLLSKERSMQIKWSEREEILEREKKDFERSVMKQAEKRIEEFRKGFISSQAQLAKEREIFDDMMEKLRERVSFYIFHFSFYKCNNIFKNNKSLVIYLYFRFHLNAPNLNKICITDSLLLLIWMKMKFLEDYKTMMLH
ncbi:putative apicomplexan conserved with transmembrane region near the C-terminus [Cryptosporidium bovis]|uniref:putative apicomplexan conserved with transmembrane region near the C-terminus n=1 Tax=Cryptosporidium bovis TaxID=310047 RepID=UPI00351A9D09|nr:putative apicomplexan conserved with transmembrane region near the C-terminus [Cryptosporidium bovis]